jgi:hypothetical protein
LASFLSEIEQDRTGFKYGISPTSRPVVIDDRGNLIVGIDPQEIGLELVAVRDIDAVGSIV